MTEKEIEDKIRERFELNYEILRAEGGHALTKDAKETALNQILFYYRRMRSIADNITETEVKLSLPDQFTPEGRRFSIEGIVDIVSEQGKVTMYDIKTHDAGYIKANKEIYERQLNVYAYIWENLRENKLNETAIISTALPPSLRAAIYLRNEERINAEIQKWDPVIPIGFNEQSVAETIDDFAKVVDKIESNCFVSPPAKRLKEKIEGSNVNFALRVCANCDGRYSCESYREYALETGIRTTQNFKKYFEDFRDDAEQENYIALNLDTEKLDGYVKGTLR
jgi:hypothetical protein